MATYESTIVISANEAELIRRYMDIEPETEDEAYIDDAIIHTARFLDGHEMDIKCCGISFFDEGGVNTAWGEAVLFNMTGYEVANEIAEDSEELLTDWTLCDRFGNEYTTHIVIKEG